MLFKKMNEKCEFDVHIQYSEHKMKMCKIVGNDISLLTALSIYIKFLKEEVNLSDKDIQNAIETGLESENLFKDNKSAFGNNVQVKEIHITKENEEDLIKLLNKLTGEDF